MSELVRVVAEGRVLALTGAGVSTISGIPDYRDDTGAWKRAKPVELRDFVRSEATRRRYWARSMLGWRWFRSARPNPAHYALAALERKGLVSLLVTQNVDGLHQAAGSREVVDLHGRLDQVVCLACGERIRRDALQESLVLANPGWDTTRGSIAPDGDADLIDADTANFNVVPCAHCGGVLKPDVVFFGENVPAPRVDRAMQALQGARALLVAGSSLMVFSGFRFARAAARLSLPLVIVNRGRTRADDLATLRVEGDVAEVLNDVVAAIG